MKRCGRYRKRRKTLPCVIAAAFAFSAAIVAYYMLAVLPVLRTVAEDEIRSLTVRSLNEAVAAAICDTPGYADIETVTYDGENKITGIRIKASVVNEIIRRATLNTQERLDSLGVHGVGVPLGSLSGITFFAGLGPKVEIRAIPVGTITSRLFSEFTEAGINQTNHRLYLRLYAKVNAILPGMNNVICAEADVPIIETVIIGKVPDTYLHATDTQDMMDLIP